MKKPLKNTIRLRGMRFSKGIYESKAWLDNTLLKLDKSLSIKAHSLNGFGWGNDVKGGLQLALAISIELYPLPVAKAVYRHLQADFLAQIQDDGFDVNLDLTKFHEEVVLSQM